MFKKIVMAFKGKTKSEEPTITIPEGNLTFKKEEIAILLQLIKASNFSGDMVEDVYNMVYKLQNSYNKIINK
tara:strand:+ start:340 stop:555 length:216 start_codon:yes stop_codon:yes gene_type:complete